tara:strand:+ start:156 stop:356 length:201 start_codon:yes stop_codon:yes gene_type:complete
MTKNKSKLIKVILHNDREALIDSGSISFAFRFTMEETSQEITRVSFHNGKELDVQESISDIYDMLS